MTNPSNPPKRLSFAGRTWRVKRGRRGPGGNLWSDSADSVWVDARGRLHLALRRDEGEWACAEVSTELPTTHGIHRFFVTGRLDRLDPNVVFALFVYADDRAEVDIEFSRWGRPSSKADAQFVVQPHQEPGNLCRFELGLQGDRSTHLFDWREGCVTFQSLHGHHEVSPTIGHEIRTWRRAGSAVPIPSRGLRVHINLWSVGAAPPRGGEGVEIRIDRADLPLVSEDARRGSPS